MELNDWNPMEEDYNSLSFNSYNRGRGTGIPIDRHPSRKNNGKFGNTSQTITLYVGKISIQIDKKGLQRLFSKYGKVLRSYLCFPKNSETNTIYGFIDYATLKEAEMAIRELDGKPPFNLRVSFYKPSKEKQEQQLIKEKEMSDYFEKFSLKNNNKNSTKRDINTSVRKEASKVKSIGRGKIFLKDTADGRLRNVPDLKIIKSKSNSDVVLVHENPDNVKESNSFSPKASNNNNCKMQEFHSNRKTEKNDFRREAYGKVDGLLSISCGQGRGSSISPGRGPKFSVSSKYNQLLSSHGQDNGFSIPFGQLGKGFQAPLGRGNGFPVSHGVDGFSALSKADSKHVQTPQGKNKSPQFSSSVNKENKISLGYINHLSNVYNQSCDDKSSPYQSFQSSNHNSLKQEKYSVNQETSDNGKSESNDITKYHSTKEMPHYQDNMMSPTDIKVSGNGNQNCIKQENLNLNCKSKNNNESHYLKHKSLYKDSFKEKLDIEKITDDVSILKQKNEHIDQSSTQICRNRVENQIKKSEIIISENNKKIELEVKNKQEKENSNFHDSRKKISLQENKYDKNNENWNENCNQNNNYRNEQYEDISRPQKSENKKAISGFFETNQVKDNLQRNDIGVNLTSNKKLDDYIILQKTEAIKSEKNVQLENKDFQHIPLGLIGNLDYLDQTIISPLQNSGINKELHAEEIYDYNSISSVIKTLQVGCEIFLLITMCDDDMFSAMIGEVPIVEEILNLDKHLNDEYSCINQSINKYKSGDLVAAFSPVDNTWFRACIKKTVEETYLIYYTDYGKEEIVKTVHPLKKKYCSLPSPAIYSKIGSISDDLQKPLCDLFLPGNMMKAAVRACKGDKYYLDLMDFESNEFICQVIAYPWNYGLFEIPDHLSDSTQNEHIQQENEYIYDGNLDKNRYKVINDTNSENFAKDDEIYNENKSLSENITSVEMYENSLVQKIQENSTVTTDNKVKIVDNMHKETVPSIVKTLHIEDEVCLTVIHVSPNKLEFQAINSNQNIVQALVEMRKSIEELAIEKKIKPQVGDVVAAQSVTDGKWYRAYILNEQNGNFKVRYIDDGNEEEIILFKILPLNLLKVISPLVYCTIEDSAECIERERIKEMLVIPKSLFGKVKYIDSNKIHITLLDRENKFLCNVTALSWYHDLLPSQSTSVNCYQKSIQSIAKPEDSTDIKICSMYQDMKKLLLSDIDNCKVKISSIVNLRKLFVQPFHLEVEIANLVSEISYFCESNPVTSYVPKINEVVCVKFKDDGLWYRGWVISSTSLTTFLVHFVDFGNDGAVESKYLRPLPEQFFKDSICCIEVAIEGLPSILPTFNIQHLCKQMWTLKVIDAENHIVKLLNSEGISLNELMKNKLISSEDEKIDDKLNIRNDDDKPVTKKYFHCEHLQFPIGQIDVLVTSIVHPEMIFCQLADYACISELVDLNTAISSYCMSQKFNFHPKCGEVCLAKYSRDGSWYRAVPLTIIDDKLQVFFVDYGNTEIVTFEETRQIISKFMTLPFQAVHCMLSRIESQQWSYEVIQKLLRILPQEEKITIKVLSKVEIDDNIMYIVDIPYVSDYLIETGLVRSSS